jgi:altronate dehydratase
MELEHEKQMKEMEFEELERQREFQKEQLDYNQKISKLKEEMEQMKRSQTFQNLKLEVPKTEIPDEIETESEIETNDEIEKESQIIVPKKLQSMFSTFAENIFRFQNEKIEEETAKELLEQNITLLKYFGKWIKAKEIEPNEVPQRLVLKKIQKILQSMTEDFEKRGFFSSSYAEFEMPEDLFDEISVLL